MAVRGGVLSQEAREVGAPRPHRAESERDDQTSFSEIGIAVGHEARRENARAAGGLAELGDDISAHASAVVAQTVEALLELKALDGAHGAALHRATERAAFGFVRDATGRMRLGKTTPSELPPDVEEWVRMWGRTRLPTSALARAARLTADVMLDHARERARSKIRLEQRASALSDLAGFLRRYADEVGESMRIRCDEERRVAHRAGLDGRRAEIIRQILSGETPPRTTLSYDFSLHHVAIIALRDGRTWSLVEVMNRAAAALEVSGPGGSERWVWMSAATKREARRLADAVVASASTRSVSAAVGEPHPGLDGFRSSHHEARQVFRLPHTQIAHVSRYRDAALLTVISQEPEPLRVFIANELRMLACPTAEAGRLRDTLVAYLEAGQQVESCAARLQVHRHTVMRRLRKIEECIDGPIASRACELALAMRLLAADQVRQSVPSDFP